MSASAPHLTELPTETLEHVLLHLPTQDIIKMETVNRRFRDLVRDSPTLQHQRELFAAGVIENPCNPCDLTERRKLHEEYVHRWSKTATMVKSTYKLPSNQFPGWDFARPIGGNILVLSAWEDRGLDFLYIPPATSGEPINMWNIPPFPFEVFAFAVYRPENILAVVEHDGRLLRTHLLDLRDGSPYCTHPSNTITWDIPQGTPPIMSGAFAITSSRVMACLSHYDGAGLGVGRTVLVWDRKTGNLVVSYPAANREGVGASWAIFLDESRIMIMTRDPSTDAPGFIVYNTLMPQDNPMGSRSFSLPPRYHNSVPVYADWDISLGTQDSDRPLITDPTQAVLVLRLSKHLRGRTILLVVRIQTLIEHVCSPHTDMHIPWAEWGRGAVMMESPPSYCSYIYVHGTHLVVLEIPYKHGGRDRPRVRTFDFGRRGCGRLPLRDEEDGGTVREALFSDRNEFVLEGAEFRVAFSSWGNVESHGDGNFFQMVSNDGPGSDITLNVWELA